MFDGLSVSLSVCARAFVGLELYKGLSIVYHGRALGMPWRSWGSLSLSLSVSLSLSLSVSPSLFLSPACLYIPVAKRYLNLGRDSCLKVEETCTIRNLYT